MEPRDRFATNLRSARHERGVSQERLAHLCDLHRTEISLLERGGREPRLGTIMKLADALEMTPNELCAGIRWLPDSGRFQFKG
jgi:transcriptional regulator with XRE-family HTH domain